MTGPTPPDPPSVIAAKYAQAATQAVNDIAKVATDAFDKVNGNPQATPPTPPTKFTPKDAIASLTQLAAAVTSGGLSLARVGLHVQWDRRILLVADNVASIVSTGVTDVIEVAGDIADKATSNSLKEQQQGWVDAAIQLTGIAAVRSAEILETVVAGPGPYLNPLIKRTFSMQPPRNIAATLAITALERSTDNLDIKSLVTIDPPGFILQPAATDFTIAVNTVGLPSGVYEGTVTATDIPPGAGVPRTLAITLAVPDTSDPPEL